MFWNPYLGENFVAWLVFESQNYTFHGRQIYSIEGDLNYVLTWTLIHAKSETHSSSVALFFQQVHKLQEIKKWLECKK